MLKVEVVFVSAAKEVFLRDLELPEGSTVLDALNQSGLYEIHPDAKSLATGVYAKPVKLNSVLKDQDRVEVYRPLSHDPKENRRIRAKKR